MKIKFAVFFMFLFMLVLAMPVMAQPARACGLVTSMAVMYDLVDASGYAPRMKEGSQAQFDCIAARDPNFSSQRFTSPIKAMNYWLFLLGQEWGVNMLLLPESGN